MEQNILTIFHKAADSKLRAMLLPYGIYRNGFVLELGVGGELLTCDEPPIRIRIREKTILPIKSKITNAICMLLYGHSIDEVFQSMLNNWSGDIQREKLLFIVYDIIKD